MMKANQWDWHNDSTNILHQTANIPCGHWLFPSCSTSLPMPWESSRVLLKDLGPYTHMENPEETTVLTLDQHNSSHRGPLGSESEDKRFFLSL